MYHILNKRSVFPRIKQMSCWKDLTKNINVLHNNHRSIAHNELDKLHASLSESKSIDTDSLESLYYKLTIRLQDLNQENYEEFANTFHNLILIYNRSHSLN